MKTYIKRFIQWIQFKSTADSYTHTPPHFKEREVWWCAVGENIGNEICGKGSFFTRPVLIIRKLDRYSFIGLPLTKTRRNGNWYTHILINDDSNTVILSQIRYYDYRRLDKRLCTITCNDFLTIKNKLFTLLFQSK